MAQKLPGGANPRREDSASRTPLSSVVDKRDQLTDLWKAAMSGNIRAVWRLIRMPGIDLNVKHANGLTLLTFIAAEGLSYELECLLQKHDDVDLNSVGRGERAFVFHWNAGL